MTESTGSELNSSDLIAAAADIVRAEAVAVAAVADQIDESFVEVVRLITASPGKVFVVGSGTSGTIARRMAHLLAVSGTPSVFIHPMDALHGTMGALAAGDVLIGISRGGETAEINDLIVRARGRGVPSVALTAEPESTMGKAADITVVLRTADGGDPGGVIAMGSTLVTAVWGDALANVLMRLSRYSWSEVLETHPAGAVGQIIEAPEELGPLSSAR